MIFCFSRIDNYFFKSENKIRQYMNRFQILKVKLFYEGYKIPYRTRYLVSIMERENFIQFCFAFIFNNLCLLLSLSRYFVILN